MAVREAQPRAVLVQESPRGGRGARVGRGAPYVVGAVVLALFVASVPLQTASHLWSQDNTPTFPVGVAYLVVGVLLASRRPDNVMGWCLLATSLFLALNIAASAYSVLDYRQHHGLPLGAVAILLQPSWAPAIVLLGLSFLLFPDGRFSSRAVKWATWLVLAAGAVWMAGAFGMPLQAVITHSAHVDADGNLLATDHPRGAWAWWSDVQVLFFYVLAFSWILWLVQQVPRYRRAGNEERHQMKWLLSGAVATIVCGVFFAVHGLSGYIGWLGWAGLIGFSVLPVTIAIGVTKFHLYAVDRLISRTLAYVLLTALVVGVYVGVVALTTKVIGFSSPVAVATSTLVAVALFNPLRKRLQRAVDRRFNRAHYDAERTVSAFAARLRETVDTGSVIDDLVDVVGAAFEPDRAAIWIRPREPA